LNIIKLHNTIYDKTNPPEFKQNILYKYKLKTQLNNYYNGKVKTSILDAAKYFDNTFKFMQRLLKFHNKFS